MKTLLEYIQKKPIIASKSDNSLAHVLALEIWSHCDNVKLDESSFEKENSEYVIFDPKGMSTSDVLKIYNVFGEVYPQFKDINFINNDDHIYIGNTITWIDIKCDLVHDYFYVSEIYLTLDVRDELIKQSNQ